MGWFWIPWFRLCWQNQDKIVLTPPLLFGRGYVFDQRREMVSICRRLLTIPLSKTEIPFSRVKDVSLRETYVEEQDTSTATGFSSNPRIALWLSDRGHQTFNTRQCFEATGDKSYPTGSIRRWRSKQEGLSGQEASR